MGSGSQPLATLLEPIIYARGRLKTSFLCDSGPTALLPPPCCPRFSAPQSPHLADLTSRGYSSGSGEGTVRPPSSESVRVWADQGKVAGRSGPWER